jgi:hypothetical protein
VAAAPVAAALTIQPKKRRLFDRINWPFRQWPKQAVCTPRSS